MTSNPLRRAAAALAVIVAWSGLVETVIAAPCAALQGSATAPPISVHCGNTPSATFDAQGALWVVFEQEGHVWLTRSDDRGATFAAPRRVNAAAEDIEHNGEGRPKLRLARNGTLLISWTLRTSRAYTGEIRFSRSTDGGASFTPPRTINDDGLLAGHRFDALSLAEDDTLYLSWIDKRDLEAATAAGTPYVGAAIYTAVSHDLGATFAPNRLVSAHACECCRIADAPTGGAGIALLYRQIFGANTRDHALALLDGAGAAAVRRATVDDWQVDACPHHGPALLRGTEPGIYHLSWFSAGARQQGLLYGRHDLATGETTAVASIDGAPGAGHPALARAATGVHLVWKGFANDTTELLLRGSRDEGRTWSEPRRLMRTTQASDHPQLLSRDGTVYLGWATAEYGYVFRALDEAR